MITKQQMQAWVHRHCRFARANRTAMQDIPAALMDERGMPRPKGDTASLAHAVAREVAREFPGARAFSQHQVESALSRIMVEHGLRPLPSGSVEKKRLMQKIFDVLDAAREEGDPQVRRPAWAA